MPDFLFEIGLEEIPARMIAGAQAELTRRVVELLRHERLLAGAPTIRSFATPRRLAVLVADVAELQDDLSEEVLGPSVKVAYRNGAPTPAAVAFARKNGVEVDALATVSTAKGDYLAARRIKSGKLASELLAAEIPQLLAQISWPKQMYWRPGRPERFVRPVRWMLGLLGSTTVPIEFGGFVAGNVTYGHRVLAGNAPLLIEAPAAYEPALLAGFVVAEVEVRRQRIRKALDRVCRTIPGARWREDHELIESVTQLTEWPSVLLGGFEPEFLELPDEVLVTVMRDHQKYFAVEDAEGKLLPHFLAVLNTESDAGGEAIIRHGNERVLRARFSDARFFWQFDQRIPLVGREALLEHVTFQRDLGSYAQKSARVRVVAAALAAKCAGVVDQAAVDQASRLLKTDLTTELVKEFTELQGIIGGLYARAQGVGELAAAAIYDQYRPASMEDRIPRTAEGQIVGLADRADTVAGMFGLGMEPTGSKDPFALRRAANGVIKILAEGSVALSLPEIAETAAEGHFELIGRMLAFFRERLEFYLREVKGQSYDVIAAVLAAGANDVRDASARAEAVSSVRNAEEGGDFVALSAAFKRMRNILEQARDKGLVIPDVVHPTLLLEPEETALAERSADLATQVEALRSHRDYVAALRAIATLRTQVDAFFDAVMVMVPEGAVRANRLALIARVLADFSRIADFSEIVVAGS